MTRIVVPRGSSGASSSNPSRQSSLPGPSSVRPETQLTPTPQVVVSAVQDEEIGEAASQHVCPEEVLEYCGSSENKSGKSDDLVLGDLHGDHMESFSNDVDCEFLVNEVSAKPGEVSKGLGRLKILDEADNEGTSSNYMQSLDGNLHPPPPPIPPPRPLSTSSSLIKSTVVSTNSPRVGSSRRGASRQVISTRSSPTASRPSSPRSHGESEGYNSADEQNSCFISYSDLERERQFEIDLRRTKGLEVKKMLEDGNCLFRAVADQVYGDSEAYDLVRQMCIDYMERERDHFSQFITEGFTSYCKRKRRDKVYGNNVEIQALSEMYNRPIHIYSYSTEPINTFQGSYGTDTPPIRLSYHHGNHYNSLVNPRRLSIGAGLGFSSLRGANVDKDQVKAAIKAQQDKQIDKALIAEGQFYSDLELTEKEIERMVMEASRVEYLVGDRSRRQHVGGGGGGFGNSSSTSAAAEPSSSSGESSESKGGEEAGGGQGGLQEAALSRSIQVVVSMGFSYLQAVEAYSIFGDDVDSMVCYLVETNNGTTSVRRKGKAAE